MYIDRTSRNEKVREEANRVIREGGGTKSIRQYSTVYTEAKANMFRRLVRADSSDPAKTTTITRELEPHSYTNRRVGRPKTKWASEAAKICWEQIRSSLGENYCNAPYDARNQIQREWIRRETLRQEGEEVEDFGPHGHEAPTTPTF